MKPNLKILIAGGGTGGHLFSGIAVADEARAVFPQGKILFVGTPFGLEKKLVPQEGYDLQFIEATPLKGSGPLLRLKSLLRLPKAYFQSKKILKNFQPDVVLGIGGYASGPMTLAAHRLGIFTAIIEQNAYPGFTNRQLARFVDRIFITFEKAREFFPQGKTQLTGNPVRRLATQESPPKDRFTVFLLGGSQGAHALNMAMLDALDFLEDLKEKIHFIHQTGKTDLTAVQQRYHQSGYSHQAFDFDSNLGKYYRGADLILCRAGAGTITELRLTGKASLLVPYPYAADDHQKHNAQEMVEQGAAELINNSQLSGKLLAEKLRYYFKNPDILETMGQAAHRQAKPKAAAEVLESCLRGVQLGHQSIQK